MIPPAPTSPRVLVVDDNEAIHQDFRKIFINKDSTTAALDEAMSTLFGTESDQVDLPTFDIDSAYQGREGVALVERAVEEGRPYTVAFVDVRMPPGWDGIETVQRMWKVDPGIQVVICTAYSDYSADAILRRLGLTDRLLILKKPFDCSEVLLMATTLNEKWNLARAAGAFTEVMLERAFEN